MLSGLPHAHSGVETHGETKGRQYLARCIDCASRTGHAGHLANSENAMATVVVHADEARLSAQTPRHALTGNWRLVLVRGIAALAVGVATLLWPHLALFTLVVMWGIYLFVDGLAALAAGLVGGHVVASHRHWWLTLAGLASVIAGIVTF